MNAKLRDEIVKAARQAGQIGFTSHISEGDRTWLLERDKDQATSAAVSACRRFLAGLKADDTLVAKALVPGTPARRELFQDEYVKAFVSTWAHELNKTPAAIARHRIQTMDWLLEGWLDTTDLDAFKKNLAENPVYAFEWADKAVAEAARRDVALYLKAIVAKAGVEAAVEYAMEQALRGARWPSHSTSAMTNIVAQAKVAAFAEVAARFTGRG